LTVNKGRYKDAFLTVTKDSTDHYANGTAAAAEAVAAAVRPNDVVGMLLRPLLTIFVELPKTGHT